MGKRLHRELPYACIVYDKDVPDEGDYYVLPPEVFIIEDPLFEDKLQPIEDEI